MEGNQENIIIIIGTALSMLFGQHFYKYWTDKRKIDADASTKQQEIAAGTDAKRIEANAECEKKIRALQIELEEERAINKETLTIVGMMATLFEEDYGNDVRWKAVMEALNKIIKRSNNDRLSTQE